MKTKYVVTITRCGCNKLNKRENNVKVFWVCLKVCLPTRVNVGKRVSMPVPVIKQTLLAVYCVAQ